MTTKPPTSRLALLGGIVVVVGFALPQLFVRATDSSPTISEGPSLLAVFLKLTLALGVLVVGSVVFAKWFAQRQSLPTLGTMERLASHTIDARVVVHLVQSGERRLLVGTDSSGVKAVVELTQPAPVRILQHRVEVPAWPT